MGLRSGRSIQQLKTGESNACLAGRGDLVNHAGRPRIELRLRLSILSAFQPVSGTKFAVLDPVYTTSRRQVVNCAADGYSLYNTVNGSMLPRSSRADAKIQL